MPGDGVELNGNGRRPPGGGTLTLFIGSGVAAAVLGGVFTFVLQQVTVPTQLSEQAAQISDLKVRFAEMEERNRRDEARLVSLRMALREVETQFRAEDAMANLQHAHDLRDFAVLWAKVMGSAYPISNSYYPAIGTQPDGDK